MGYEKMERDFTCPCGAGKLVAEWEEHDTWPSSNRSVKWHFDCPECSATFTFDDWIGTRIIRQLDAAKLEELTGNERAATEKIEKSINPRYLEKWVSYVLAQDSKAAMHRAVGQVSYGAFLRKGDSPDWVTGQAKRAYILNPKRCLEILGITDEHVDALHQERLEAQQATAGFRSSIEKIEMPDFS